jgi:hypothetical protein
MFNVYHNEKSILEKLGITFKAPSAHGFLFKRNKKYEAGKKLLRKFMEE